MGREIPVNTGSQAVCYIILVFSVSSVLRNCLASQVETALCVTDQLE